MVAQLAGFDSGQMTGIHANAFRKSFLSDALWPSTQKQGFQRGGFDIVGQIAQSREFSFIF